MKRTEYCEELLVSVEVARGFGNWYGAGAVVHGGRHCVVQVERWRGGEVGEVGEVGAVWTLSIKNNEIKISLLTALPGHSYISQQVAI